MDLTGKTVGKYRLIEKLGSGGMAEVYKAFQSGVERDVAIKVMHGHLAAEEDFRERFQREARAVGQLQHPNIMRVIDFDEADGDFYMVMEFLSGGTLRDYLTEKKELPVPEALRIIRQLCDALSYAHARGMIHRDIKPGNVMFSDATHMRAILTDFGMARMLNEAKLTVSGAMLGTPAYMPPEVVKGEPADHRADFYSTGAVLYEMVTGRTPHIADTSYAVLMMQVNDPLPLPSEFKPDIDPALEAFLIKSLAKEPEERFADAQEMLAAIDALEGKATTTVAGATVVKKAEPPTLKPTPAAKQPANNNKWLMIGGAVAGIILIALVGIWLMSRNDDPTAEFAPTATAAIEAVAEDTAVPTELPDPTEAPAVEPTAAAVTETETETETAVPTEAPTTEPTPELVATLDIAQQALAVSNIQFSGQQADGLSLSLARIPQPAANTEHVVWLIGDAGAQALGVLPVDGTDFTAPVESNVTDFNSLVISMEPAGAAHSEITGERLFEQQLPAEFLASMRALLNEHLLNGEAQLAIASQHAGFMRDELAAGNLPGARLHAEHVVNILDGADGADFGDLNGDGRPENPGDDVGVRTYLESALADANAALAASETTPFSQSSADKTVQSLENSIVILAEAQNSALRIFAVDTAVEGQPVADELQIFLQQVQDGADNDGNGVVDALAGEGGITAVTDNALNWLVRSYVAARGTNAAADSPAGTVRFAPNALTLTIHDVPLPPADSAYHAWLVNEAGTADLGTLAVDNNEIRAVFPVNELAFEQNDQLLITLGSEPTDTAVFTASLPPETQAALVNVLAVDAGLISSLTAQTQLAVDHAGFMRDDLTAGNLASGKVHAEHVINILVGEEAAEFGDLDGNGRAENPGDGVGVRVYLQQVAEQLALVEPDSVERQFYAALTAAAIDNSLLILSEVINNVGKVLASDTAEEALVTAEEMQPQVASLFSGTDQDENGVADPLTGEGGIQALRDLVTALGYWAVTAVSE